MCEQPLSHQFRRQSPADIALRAVSAGLIRLPALRAEGQVLNLAPTNGDDDTLSFISSLIHIRVPASITGC